MATSEALIKYYDCLKDSFNRIQDKDNKTALVNAALRPKIREEFAKNKDVLRSYLNYVQIFSIIYSEKFINICNSIIIPLFKEEDLPQTQNKIDDAEEDNELDNVATKIHDTLSAILKSRPELEEDYIQSVIKVFPGLTHEAPEDFNSFCIYLRNCLKIFTYIQGDSSVNLMTKILDRLNPPINDLNSEDLYNLKKNLNDLYEILYKQLDSYDDSQRAQFANILLTSFTRDFISSENYDQLNYLILYVCSFGDEVKRNLLDSLWEVFTDNHRPIKERRDSAIFLSSFVTRATYIDLEEVFTHLESLNSWCTELIDNNNDRGIEPQGSNEVVECFQYASQSMFYIITQRYREMYEDESIKRLVRLNLGDILGSKFKPLDFCDSEIKERFIEVATLYNITDISYLRSSVSRKSARKSSINSSPRFNWKVPFAETDNDKLPMRIKNIYRLYYDHRNFTVYRD